MQLKIAAATYGCKVNQYETSCILNDFIELGCIVVDFDESADIYLINTCTVTNRTDYKSRNSIRKALQKKKIDPHIKVIVTGCYSQRHREDILTLGDIDFFIDNNSKNKAVEILKDSLPEFRDIFSYREFSEHTTPNLLDRSRAYVKIQDGCDYFCSYCAVPFGRGRSRSRKTEDVIAQIRLLTEQGYREFVIGGVNLGLYGRDLDKQSGLIPLLEKIETIDNVILIRLSSLEPDLIDEDLIGWFGTSSKLAPHFHIPLQSGSDEILKSMKRHYNSGFFQKKVETVMRILPDAAFGFDVIVGFPGENDDHFQQTCDLVQKLPTTYLHIFPYSRRPKTCAATMKNPVNGRVIQHRVRKLQQIDQQKKIAYLDKLIKNRQILRGVVEKESDGFWSALSDHYVRIYFEEPEKDMTKTVAVGIPEKVFRDGLIIGRYD